MVVGEEAGHAAGLSGSKPFRIVKVTMGGTERMAEINLPNKRIMTLLTNASRAVVNGVITTIIQVARFEASATSNKFQALTIAQTLALCVNHPLRATRVQVYGYFVSDSPPPAGAEVGALFDNSLATGSTQPGGLRIGIGPLTLAVHRGITDRSWTTVRGTYDCGFRFLTVTSYHASNPPTAT